MPPVIGITTNQSTNANGQPTIMLMQSYVNAVIQAGGVPVLIPSLIAEAGWDAVYARLDGILFSGGGDIALEYSPGEPHPRIDGVDRARDSVELKMVQAAALDGKPFLGICRGCQVMNVALGGTLYTHIPDQLPNRSTIYPGNIRAVLVHEIKIEEGTHIADFNEPSSKSTACTIRDSKTSRRRSVSQVIRPTVWSKPSNSPTIHSVSPCNGTPNG
jgi:putative glutamine amidotransferase